MEAYDAAVIGAGAEGLAAAAVLSRAGLRTIVLERSAAPGGRCTTIEFYSGFRASPFSDEVAAIPLEYFREFGLARRGVFFAAAPTATAIWHDRHSTVDLSDLRTAENRLRQEAHTRRRNALERAMQDASANSRRGGKWMQRPWPGEDWAWAPLARIVADTISDPDAASHAIHAALCGRAADPMRNGSALHLLAANHGSGIARGGLGELARALAGAAQEAGAAISCGLDVTDIRHLRGRVTGVALADGMEIAAGAVISTLDLKRTFLSHFKWDELSAATFQRVKLFRSAAATARLLVALDGLPERAMACGALRGPIAIAPDVVEIGRAYASWRAGVLADRLPLTVRFVSAVDPSLAVDGQATMTVTIGCVPHHFFDGAWTHARREMLCARVLAAIDEVFPRTNARVLGLKLITPPDIEDAIARTDGDLAGGDIASDQMLGSRPWAAGVPAPRTAMRGLYLAGPSTTSGLLSTCISGVAAARALITDTKRTWWS